MIRMNGTIVDSQITNGTTLEELRSQLGCSTDSFLCNLNGAVARDNSVVLRETDTISFIPRKNSGSN